MHNAVETGAAENWLDAIRWNSDGLVPAIAQDADTGDILMMAWMNRESQGGIACHTGRRSCFYRTLKDGQWQAVDPVIKDPDAIYGSK